MRLQQALLLHYLVSRLAELALWLFITIAIASSERSQCKRREPRSTPLPASNSTVLVAASITTPTSLYLATSFRVPSGPFGATLSDSPTSMLTVVTDVKVTVEDGHRVAIRRRGINNLFKWIGM